MHVVAVADRPPDPRAVVVHTWLALGLGLGFGLGLELGLGLGLELGSGSGSGLGLGLGSALPTAGPVAAKPPCTLG